MLSVIIRTFNGERFLLDVLSPLVSGAADGAVRDVAFLDLGSSDGTQRVADVAGAEMVRVESEPERIGAGPLARALKVAHRGEWVMLLDQTTVLGHGWLSELLHFIERQNRVSSQRARMTAAFRPEHQPELGSADVIRRTGIVLANRLFNRARLSQGVVVRRSDLAHDKAARIDWQAADPIVHAGNLLRLRTRSLVAEPFPEARAATSANGAPAQQT
jgi:GT2 family glycosyltransferase